jgi:hypothetical protein
VDEEHVHAVLKQAVEIVVEHKLLHSRPCEAFRTMKAGLDHHQPRVAAGEVAVVDRQAGSVGLAIR